MQVKLKVKFKFRKISLAHPFKRQNYILRPIIPVSLKGNNLILRLEALIDSGADFNIFPLAVAKRLGVLLKKNKKIQFSGIEGGLVEGEVGEVNIMMGNLNFKTWSVFTDSATTILGQYGFFDHFKVNFDLQKKEIEIKSK